jgi:murein DD-endopeptidase MepM/ murein hydrolase activator NlpD
MNKPRAKRTAGLIVAGLLVTVASIQLLNLQSPRAYHESGSEPEKNSPASERTGARPAPLRKNGPEPADGAPSAISESDSQYLQSKGLLIPVQGVTPNKLTDTFDQARSEGRRHEAIDIMAPKGTPVLATADGKIVRLFQSDKGGTTIYELDPSLSYVYYYAHLSSYAVGIAEGVQVHRGDVIGDVGDSGNAGAGNFHLHFAISKISSPKRWSGGTPINPYPLLRGHP